MFGRATIRLGIGPHSSFVMLCNVSTSGEQTLNLQVLVCAVCLHVQMCSNLKVCVHI